MRVGYLRLVPSVEEASVPQSPAERIMAASHAMMAQARSIRVAAGSLKTSAGHLKVIAGQMNDHLPVFAEAERRLLVERDRAYEIANDAAIIERRILNSSPGNLLPLTAGLPARLAAGVA